MRDLLDDLGALVSAGLVVIAVWGCAAIIGGGP